MATVNLGRIKPIFKGAYAGGTAYVVDDIVTSGNETFICIQAGTGNATSNASYWTKLAAKGADGSNGTNGTDLTSTLTTQGDIVYRDGSGLQRLGKPASNKFLQMTSGGVASWETVTSKLLGHTIKVDQTGVDMGNINRAVYVITQLNTSHTVQSANSRFVINVKVHGGSPNHQKFWYQWSKDNSNWYHTSEAGNAGFTAVSLSGHGIDWSSALYHRYPQIGITTDADTNRHAPGTATSQLLPSGSSHTVGSTLYVRVGSFCSNDTSSMFYNRNGGNTGNDGTICQSSVEVFEYAL